MHLLNTQSWLKTVNGKIEHGNMMKICDGRKRNGLNGTCFVDNFFRVRIWIEAIGSTPERWLDDFPNGFTHHWDFDNLRSDKVPEKFQCKVGITRPERINVVGVAIPYLLF